MQENDDHVIKRHEWRGLHFHCPHVRYEVKKRHYKTVLFVGGCGLLIFHHYMPDHEILWAVTLNTLFVIDPTA